MLMTDKIGCRDRDEPPPPTTQGGKGSRATSLVGGFFIPKRPLSATVETAPFGKKFPRTLTSPRTCFNEGKHGPPRPQTTQRTAKTKDNDKQKGGRAGTTRTSDDVDLDDDKDDKRQD